MYSYKRLIFNEIVSMQVILPTYKMLLMFFRYTDHDS